MAIRKRSRNVVGPTAVGFNNGNLAGSTLLPGLSETIEDATHSTSLLGKRDCGGPMLLTREKWEYTLPHCTSSKWAGSDFVFSGGPTANPPSPPSDLSMTTQGATAISRSIPTNPAFNSFTALGEALADGMPAMLGAQTWKRRTQVANNAGGEYLNVQFGWLPLISDIRSFAHAVKSSHQILAELKAGSGSEKWTRVGYHFPSSTSFSTGTGNINMYRGGNTGIVDTTSYNYVVYSRQETWFSGAFSYHLPVSDSMMNKASLYAEYADTLLGVKPTPSAIWNCSPWTWALDWFANGGDVMNNISELHQNGLALEYGYLMSSSLTREYLVSAALSGYITSGSRTRIREYKKRFPSNPYGFGVTDASLSNAQKAVIVALGLTGFHGGKG